MGRHSLKNIDPTRRQGSLSCISGKEPKERETENCIRIVRSRGKVSTLRDSVRDEEGGEADQPVVQTNQDSNEVERVPMSGGIR